MEDLGINHSFEKGYEVVNQLHTHLNPCMNDEILPLTYKYYIEKYHLGYHLEGAYDKKGILHLSSVYYNGLPEDNDNFQK